MRQLSAILSLVAAATVLGACITGTPAPRLGIIPTPGEAWWCDDRNVCGADAVQCQRESRSGQCTAHKEVSCFTFQQTMSKPPAGPRPFGAHGYRCVPEPALCEKTRTAYANDEQYDEDNPIIAYGFTDVSTCQVVTMPNPAGNGQ